MIINYFFNFTVFFDLYIFDTKLNTKTNIDCRTLINNLVVSYSHLQARFELETVFEIAYKF